MKEVKVIIFDIDYTLIMWDSVPTKYLEETFIDMNIAYTKDLLNQIYKAVDDNEYIHDKLDKVTLLNYINETCKTNLSMDFLNKYIDHTKECINDNKDVLDTIKYLSKKYDLYAISNWFTSAQRVRLDKMGILKYFKKVIGADINYFKPHLKVFNVIIDKYSKNECLSIGDSLEKDVKSALKVGMKAIWKTDVKSDKYITIKEIKELKTML